MSNFLKFNTEAARVAMKPAKKRYIFVAMEFLFIDFGETNFFGGNIGSYTPLRSVKRKANKFNLLMGGEARIVTENIWFKFKRDLLSFRFSPQDSFSAAFSGGDFVITLKTNQQ